jgi:hypothetical protein
MGESLEVDGFVEPFYAARGGNPGIETQAGEKPSIGCSCPSALPRGKAVREGSRQVSQDELFLARKKEKPGPTKTKDPVGQGKGQ